MNYTQLNMPYQATIQDIQDTGKVFKGGGIDKRKYIITFTDGFQAEYCPPALQLPSCKQGDLIEFKVIHMGSKGIEIEVIGVVNAGGQTSPALKGVALSANSMVGHPAAIAITVAKDMAVVNGWSFPAMLEKAETVMQWLIERKDLDSYKF